MQTCVSENSAMLFEEVCNVNDILWDTFAMLRSSFRDGALGWMEPQRRKSKHRICTDKCSLMGYAQTLFDHFT